jgi:muramidase (phage lysozyme)
MPRSKFADPNLSAFLDMLAWSEGTSTIKTSDDGYNVIVGGTLFSSYADHPRILVTLRPGLKSTAAGRYQILARYFDAYKAALYLADFSPESQDLIAVKQIREAKAYNLVLSGQFMAAVHACAHLWASLPGAGYSQHENRMSDIVLVYKDAGGKFTQA